MERKRDGRAKIAKRFRDRVGRGEFRGGGGRRGESARREISSCRSFTSREGDERAVKIE